VKEKLKKVHMGLLQRASEQRAGPPQVTRDKDRTSDKGRVTHDNARAVLPPYITLPLIFLLVGILLIAFAAWLIAQAMLRPPRMTDGKAMYVLRRLSPGDLELPFESMAFHVRDQQRNGATTLRLASWWIPAAAPSDRCAILLHGYADAKVGVIAWAPLWRELGFNILALDLRGHGESGGRDVTGGFYERHDVDQVIDLLQSERPNETRRIVLFGASLGGAVALATADLRNRKARRGSTRSCWTVPLPTIALRWPPTPAAWARRGTLILPLAIGLAQATSGARFDDVRAADVLARVRCPVMVIESADDDFAGSDARLIERAIAQRPAESQQRSLLWRVPGAAHLMAIVVAPEAYARRLREFLNNAAS
jgi:pimeloyl-ACP methyl ester carboxylesterase